MDNCTQKSDEHSESEEEIFVHPVDTEAGDEWLSPLSVNGILLPLKIDTGAQANLLSMKDYNARKQRPKLKKRETNLTLYNNDSIPTVRTCHARVNCNDIAYNTAFVVVTGDDKTSLLRSRASELMVLGKKSQHVQVYDQKITYTKSCI